MNVEAFSCGNSISKLILWSSKPSFQPSIPNIHLTSQIQTRDGAVSYNNAKRTIPVREKQKKILTIIGQTIKRINQTNSKTKQSSEKECVRDERGVPESSSMVHKRMEDRRREAIEFEIPA